MHHTHTHMLPHQRPILPTRPHPQPLAPPNHNQKHSTSRHTHKSSTNEAIPRTQPIQPRRNPIPNSKAHRIADNDHGRHAITTNRRVTINEIVHTQRNAASITESSAAHGDNEAEPVDMVSSAYTPEDEGCGENDEADGESPEALFGLVDAVAC